MKQLLCLVLLATPFATAQDQATTLAAACDRADAVVLATVTAVTDPSPEWHRMEWRADEVLSGQIGAQFTLLEPAGACCGRSLFALGLGQQRLLFLQRHGPRLHPLGGARGIVPASAVIIAHVRALLAATPPAARAALLANCLDHPEYRIAADAAGALAVQPSLALDGAARARVAQALELAVRRGSTSAAALLDVTVRIADPELLDNALALYLSEPAPDKARLLRRALSRVAPALLTGRMSTWRHGDRSVQLRTAELLRDVPGSEGEGELFALLGRTTCPRVQLCAAEGLLSAGTPASALRSSLPAPVLDLAQHRVAAARFRSIDPAPR